MPEFPVSPNTAEELKKRMDALGLYESDLEESFIRSGGHGGQNVNKVSTCVVLVHRPTGLQVRCERERSQGMNRFLARRLMCEKLEEKVLGEQSRKRQEIEKLRRQKRKRSKRAKAKMLDEKRKHGQKKASRRASHDE